MNPQKPLCMCPLFLQIHSNNDNGILNTQELLFLSHSSDFFYFLFFC